MSNTQTEESEEEIWETNGGDNRILCKVVTCILKLRHEVMLYSSLNAEKD